MPMTPERKRALAETSLEQHGAVRAANGSWSVTRGVRVIPLGDDPVEAWRIMPFYCSGCGVNVKEIGEYAYMVTEEVWAKAGGFRGDSRMQCVGCLEESLGRCLRRSDFEWRLPLNWDPPAHVRTSMRDFIRSDRLRNRMNWNGIHYANLVKTDES